MGQRGAPRLPSAGPLAPSPPPCPRSSWAQPPQQTRLPGSRDRTCRGAGGWWGWEGERSSGPAPGQDRGWGSAGGLSGPSAAPPARWGASLTFSKVAGFAQMRCLCPGSELLVLQGGPSLEKPQHWRTELPSRPRWGGWACLRGCHTCTGSKPGRAWGPPAGLQGLWGDDAKVTATPSLIPDAALLPWWERGGVAVLPAGALDPRRRPRTVNSFA